MKYSRSLLFPEQIHERPLSLLERLVAEHTEAKASRLHNPPALKFRTSLADL
jgi:hypothetical protein